MVVSLLASWLVYGRLRGKMEDVVPWYGMVPNCIYPYLAVYPKLHQCGVSKWNSCGVVLRTERLFEPFLGVGWEVFVMWIGFRGKCKLNHSAGVSDQVGMDRLIVR
jgi:hypothetical protein